MVPSRLDHPYYVREAAKKALFYSGPNTKALTPPPLGLRGHRTFF